jgi:nucleoside-diphosphate-sugar epimerase
MRRAFVTGGSGFVGRRLIATLRGRGVEVRALARSPSAQRAVAELGAEAVAGDLDAIPAGALAGCDAVFHLAAITDLSKSRAEFVRVNVDGTRRVLEAARRDGAGRVVHCSTEAVLVGAGPIVRADETRAPLARPPGLYPLTKALAERTVLDAVKAGQDAVIVRPRFVWGKGDTTLLPRLLAAMRAGRWAWLGGGDQLTSTCHVDNACEGLILAAERGEPGAIYFVTDGEPARVKDFITALVATQGVVPQDRRLGFRTAYALATVVDAVWGAARAFGVRSEPPLSRTAVLLMGQEVTVDDSRARRELGYQGRVTREAGLDEMTRSGGTGRP